MLTLTLVRHAKSSWDDPALDDFERPLNPRGRRDAPLMAARCVALGGAAPQLLSSPALRALSTARIFADELGIAFEQMQLEPRIYEASTETLMKLLRERREATPHLMLFGHNPGFSLLARRLAEVPFAEMPTCAVLRLALDATHWRDLTPGCGKVLAYLYPKQDTESSA